MSAVFGCGSAFHASMHRFHRMCRHPCPPHMCPCPSLCPCPDRSCPAPATAFSRRPSQTQLGSSNISTLTPSSSDFASGSCGYIYPVRQQPSPHPAWNLPTPRIPSVRTPSPPFAIHSSVPSFTVRLFVHSSRSVPVSSLHRRTSFRLLLQPSNPPLHLSPSTHPPLSAAVLYPPHRPHVLSTLTSRSLLMHLSAPDLVSSSVCLPCFPHMSMPHRLLAHTHACAASWRTLAPSSISPPQRRRPHTAAAATFEPWRSDM